MKANNFPEELRKYIPNVYAKDPTILGSVDRQVMTYFWKYLTI
jgi:hypothetical protein